jgi:hypothetical protein
LYQAARALQQESLQDEINRTLIRSQLEEMLTQQRTVESWQEQLRQQQLLSQPRAYLNHNRLRDDPISSLLQNRTLRDQLLQHQLLLSRTTAHQSQTGLPLNVTAVNRPRETTLLPHNDVMLSPFNLPRNVSSHSHLMQALGESNLARPQQNQQLLGDLDLHAATLYGASPLAIDNPTFRQRATIAPAFSEYETDYTPNNLNDINAFNIAVANAIAGQNLMSNMSSNVPERAKGVDGDGEDNDDDKKPPGTRK